MGHRALGPPGARGLPADRLLGLRRALRLQIYGLGLAVRAPAWARAQQPAARRSGRGRRGTGYPGLRRLRAPAAQTDPRLGTVGATRRDRPGRAIPSRSSFDPAGPAPGPAPRLQRGPAPLPRRGHRYRQGCGLRGPEPAALAGLGHLPGHQGRELQPDLGLPGEGPRPAGLSLRSAPRGRAYPRIQRARLRAGRGSPGHGRADHRGHPGPQREPRPLLGQRGPGPAGGSPPAGAGGRAGDGLAGDHRAGPSLAALGGGERGVSEGLAGGRGRPRGRGLSPVPTVCPELLQRAREAPGLHQIGPGHQADPLGQSPGRPGYIQERLRSAPIPPRTPVPLHRHRPGRPATARPPGAAAGRSSSSRATPRRGRPQRTTRGSRSRCWFCWTSS